MLLKIHGGQLQVSIAYFKCRLYALLVNLQPNFFEGNIEQKTSEQQPVCLFFSIYTSGNTNDVNFIFWDFS